MKTALRIPDPTPARLPVPCQWCRTQEVDNGRGAVVCPRCDAPGGSGVAVRAVKEGGGE